MQLPARNIASQPVESQTSEPATQPSGYPGAVPERATSPQRARAPAGRLRAPNRSARQQRWTTCSCAAGADCSAAVPCRCAPAQCQWSLLCASATSCLCALPDPNAASNACSWLLLCGRVTRDCVAANSPSPHISIHRRAMLPWPRQRQQPPAWVFGCACEHAFSGSGRARFDVMGGRLNAWQRCAAPGRRATKGSIL